MKEFSYFCKSTTLHGWNRFNEKQTNCRRLYWGLVICTSLALTGYSVFRNVDSYLNSYVETYLVTTTSNISAAEFPMIHICNVYNVRQSFVDAALRNNGSKSISQMRTMKKTLRKYFQISDEINEAQFMEIINTKEFEEAVKERCQHCKLDKRNLTTSVALISRIAQQNPFNMVLYIKIQQDGYEKPFTTSSETMSSTDDKICYSIKPDPKKYTIRSGKPYGIELLLDSESFDNGNIDSPFNGLNIFVDDENGAVPILHLKEIPISSGRFVTLLIKLESYRTTEDAKNRFTHKERKCIYEGEFTTYKAYNGINHGINYSMSTCIYAAMWNEIMKKCSYKKMPSWQNALKCYGDHRARIGTWKTLQNEEGGEIECQEACERQKSIVSVATQTFPNDIFIHGSNFLLVLQKLFYACQNYMKLRLLKIYPKICPFYEKYFFQLNSTQIFSFLNNKDIDKFYNELEGLIGMNETEQAKFVSSVLDYSKDNLIYLRAYITDPYMAAYETRVVMTEITFISNLGGVMGLCIGFSLVSLAEIFYHLLFNPALSWMERISKCQAN